MPGAQVQLLTDAYYEQAASNFATYRLAMRPNMKWNWWTEEVAGHLERFKIELLAGRAPILAICAPPQHGKSWTISDFISYITGNAPHLKTIFGSYSDDLGVRTNLDVQRAMASERYSQVFPHVNIGLPGWQCNTDVIEFGELGELSGGYFRNTTVNGPITGMEINLGVIDDPVKGRREANSKTIREQTWLWFTDDFLSRFSTNAALLIILTRWHIDDLLGRAIQRFGRDIRILRYPAIAEIDDRGHANWNDRRHEGEALFPELKPLSFLKKRRTIYTDASWEALYQQNPYRAGGGKIPIHKLNYIDLWDRSEVQASVRYWDKASSVRREGYTPTSATAGVLMHKLVDGRFVISHCAGGFWNEFDREARIKTFAEADSHLYPNYHVVVEREPGSGGKDSAAATIRNLAGYNVTEDRVTGAKEIRAEPFVAQCQGGNVWLVAGEWVHGFLDEAELWPQGRRRDKIDAAAGAFNTLVKDTEYNQNFDQWS